MNNELNQELQRCSIDSKVEKEIRDRNSLFKKSLIYGATSAFVSGSIAFESFLYFKEHNYYFDHEMPNLLLCAFCAVGSYLNLRYAYKDFTQKKELNF